MAADRDESRIYSDAEQYLARWSITNRGRVPRTWYAALKADPLLRTAAVVVDLSLAAGQRRLLLGPKYLVLGTGMDNTRRSVMAEMIEEPDLTESITIGEAGPQGRSVAVSVSGRLVKPKDVLASGWPMAGRGEVSLVADGVSWDDRLIWIRGPMSGGVQFGRDSEFIDITINDPPATGSEIPPWVLDTDRWSALPSSSVGERVPIIIGKGITPCPRVDITAISDTDDPDYPGGTNNEFLVCYGYSVTVEDVWISGTLVPSSYYTILQTTDGLGLTVTTIRFNASYSAAADSNAEVHARVEASTNSASLDLAGGIRIVLRDYGGFIGDRVSERLFAEASSRSAAFGPPSTGIRAPRIVINQASGAIEYVSGGLLGSYPYMSLAWDGAGIGPVAIDHRAPPVTSLTRDVYPMLGRPEGVRYQETPMSELRTSFALRYDYQAVRDTYSAVVTRNRNNNALCALAAAAIGSDQADPQRDSVTIDDSATAGFVMDWLCEHFCRPAYDVQVDAYPAAWFLLRLGDTITWTDDHAGFSDVKAIVTGRTWSHGKVTITLRCFPRLWNVGGGSLTTPGASGA